MHSQDHLTSCSLLLTMTINAPLVRPIKRPLPKQKVQASQALCNSQKVVVNIFSSDFRKLIPKPRPHPNGGRRRVADGIYFVLRTGCPYKAAPSEYGSGSSLHRYFQRWQKYGLRWAGKKPGRTRPTAPNAGPNDRCSLTVAAWCWDSPWGRPIDVTSGWHNQRSTASRFIGPSHGRTTSNTYVPTRRISRGNSIACCVGDTTFRTSSRGVKRSRKSDIVTRDHAAGLMSGHSLG